MQMNYLKVILIILLFCHTIQAQNIIKEEVELLNGTIHLSGTLSYPESEKPIPLAIFIHGSGNVDRNGNQAGLNIKPNYIKQLAESLNRNTIAFYRYDKRNANLSNIPLLDETSVFDDLVEDAALVIEHFSGDSRFKNITVIGHSQGSLTAILAFNENFSKFISLAGASDTFGELLVSQIDKQSKELGTITREHLKELKDTDTIQKVNFMLQSIFKPFNHNFIKSYNAYRPTEVIKKIHIPTLLVNGSSDLQITVKDAKKLKQAKPDATLVIIPQMNHVLKTVTNLEENQSSYLTENFAISQELIEVISGFIKN